MCPVTDSATARRTLPRRRRRSPSICAPTCSSSRMQRRTYPRYSSPAAVRRTPRGSRSNSGAPSSSSRSSTRRLRADEAMCSASAALRMEPCRATASMYAKIRGGERGRGGRGGGMAVWTPRRARSAFGPAFRVEAPMRRRVYMRPLGAWAVVPVVSTVPGHELAEGRWFGALDGGLVHHPALAHHEDPRREREDLVEVRAHQEHRGPPVAGGAQARVDLGHRGEIEAHTRIGRHEDVDVALELARQHGALDVAS